MKPCPMYMYSPYIAAKRGRDWRKVATFWKDQLDKFTERSDKVLKSDSIHPKCHTCCPSDPQAGISKSPTGSGKRNKVRVFTLN